MTDLIGQTIDNFRIERQLGQGGMGVVYEATDMSLNRRVALKIMHKHLAARESFQQRFVREAQNAARLKHPNIVQIHHFFSKQGQLFLVMELLEDGSLQDYIDRLRQQGRRMERDEALELTRQIASGLHYAHQQGMIHRDIKPANILLTRDTDGSSPYTAYRALIADFGLAKLLQEMQSSQTGPVGTLAYMSPEQVLGGKVDARSDIYALGVILFELVVGYRPFNPQSLRDAVRTHRSGPVLTPANRPPGLPMALEEIINRCLAADPQDRYQSAHEIAYALRQFMENDPERAVPTQPEPAPKPAPRQEPPPKPKVDNRRSQTHFTNPTWPHTDPSMYPPADRSDLFGFDLLMIRYKSQQLDPIAIQRDLITIGRDNSNHVALQGAKSEISRNHARIERNPEGGYYIVDLGSTNGTYLGRERLQANIPRFWDPREAVRIGDYWLRIDIARDRGVRMPVQEPGRTERHDASRNEEPQAESEHIQVQPSQTHVIVEAGSYNDINVAVTNRSKFVDHYALQVEGLPPEWVVLPDRQLKLLPEKQESLGVRLHPPRASESRAGQHRFILRVASVKYANVFVTIPCILEINPYHQFSASLQPRLIHRNEPALITIINEGNAPDQYELAAKDNQYALTFETPEETLEVDAGHALEVPLGVISRSQSIFGSPKVYPFDVTVTGKGQRAGTKQLQGALQVQPMLPTWVLALAALIGIAACLLLALLLTGLLGASQSQNATATARAEVTRLTAEAGLDSDDDGLTDERERQLGTDPFVADTDGDGLSDGEEVRVHSTNPTKADTDDDTLRDGAEVAGCTSPNNADTNGNGVPDNIDPAPCEAASPTPTLTPTKIPTAEPPPTATATNTAVPTPIPPPTSLPPPTIIVPPTAGQPTSTTIPFISP